jgi:hypothetical protein
VTRYLALVACVLWTAAALAQSDDRMRPSDGQETSGQRPSEGSKIEVPPEGSKLSTDPRMVSLKWGAVAYTADGAFGAAYGYDSREEAERLAIDACMKESTDKGDCSRGVVTRQDAWFYIQFCRIGGDWNTRITTDPTLAGASGQAEQFARTSKYGPGNCRMVPNGTFHSGGLHLKR